MEDIDALRKKKLIKLQQQLQNQSNYDEETQLNQQIEQLESMVRQKLSKDALARYGSLKTAHPETAMQLLSILGQAIQAGQIRKEISDEEFKGLLSKIHKATRKEFHIRNI